MVIVVMRLAALFFTFLVVYGSYARNGSDEVS
jgi:hypothetical protein